MCIILAPMGRCPLVPHQLGTPRGVQGAKPLGLAGEESNIPRVGITRVRRRFERVPSCAFQGGDASRQAFVRLRAQIGRG